MKRKKLGFTLIELLAVIVVIVVVLAITIPIVSNIIETVRREAFKATAYSISDSGRFLMANDNDLGYEEFYYLDGVQYNAGDLKLDYTGDGPKTGVVILNDNKKVAMAIHDGTYCATKSSNTNKITISETTPEDCKAYNIINTCDTWEQIALKYDVNLDDLLKENNVTDVNSSTCDLNIKIPLNSTSTNNHYADDGNRIYYKTYYSVGYVGYSESFTTTSYEYTIKLGVLPLNISDIEVVRVTTQSVFESLDDFKRYITKKNMGEVVWPGDVNPPEIDISQASVFRDHALRSTNMNADDVTVMCDEIECTATINITVDNMNNVYPNYINEIPIAYTPVKFTVEFNGQADTCSVRSTTDVAPGTLAGTGTGADPYLVESIEDLVALSNNVTAGNTYSGKYIAFTNSFDFSNKRSYKDFSTTAYGDINGNGTVEGLQVELTTGAGFNPIGNGTTKFSGNVIGNANCIYDLYINRPTTSHVGFIGFQSSGTIKALSLIDANVTGLDNTGGLVGRTDNGTIVDNVITGNVTGNNQVGMAVGYFYTDSSRQVTSIIVEGNVTGANNIGGLVGYTYTYWDDSKCYIRGIHKNGNITSTGTSVGRILGGTGTKYGGPTPISALALSSVTINGATITSNSQTSKNGADIVSLSELKDINLVEVALDTHIGGDNDGSGYHWYSDISGNLLRSSVADYPIVFSLLGSGTIADPYLISTYEDLVQAQLNLGAVYALTTNIDLSGKPNFMLGSYVNPFRGTFEGNNKTISNYTLTLPQISYTGFFGTNSGTVRYFELNNANINGGSYTGALAGTNSGTIMAINMNNLTVNGLHYTGGIAGYNSGVVKLSNITNIDIVGQDNTGGMLGYTINGEVTDSVVEGNVTGNNQVGMAAGYFYSNGSRQVTSIVAEGNVTGNNNVGGIVGYAYTYWDDSKCYIRGIYKNGSINSIGTSVGRILGGNGSKYGGPVPISALAKSSITINGSAVTSNSQTSKNGADITSLDELKDINLVEVGLDTHIGGDNDANGYYWYGDASGNLIRQAISDYSIVFGLTGAGTAADPYLISNYDDLVEAQLKLSSVYRLANDIDLSGKPNFMLGSYINPFKGTFEGDNKTISNYTLTLPQIGYVGFFGTNSGTIKDITLNNTDITGVSYTGTIAGTNSGTITSLILSNNNVSGYSYTGGISGYNSGVVKLLNLSNIDIVGQDNTGGMLGYTINGEVTDNVIEGNVTGNNQVGMAAGYFYSNGSRQVTSIVAEGNVTGSNNVGGIVGYAYTYWDDSICYIRGIYMNGSITSTGTNVGRILGGSDSKYGGPIPISALATSSVSVNSTTVTSNYQTSKNGADLSSLSLLRDINLVEVALDTHIGGDNDANGYYWYGDAAGNLIHQSTSDYSVAFGLAGAGTATDPYLISNYDDLIEAQLKLSSVYRLVTDIDMTGKPNFMLGSYINPFKGTFEGNNKTINNYTLTLPQIGYVGFFGTNTGTIKDMTLNNTNITGVSYAGTIAGTNSGTIMAINMSSSKVTGLHYTGGIAGYNSGVVKLSNLSNIDIVGQDNTGGMLGYTINGEVTDNVIEGNVTGNNQVGLAAGYFYSNGSRQVTSIVAEGNVTGNNNVGGIIGYAYTYWDDSKCYIRGIYKNGSINSIGTSVGRILGGSGSKYGGPIPISALALSSVTVNGSTVASNSQTSKNGADISSLTLLKDINLVEVAMDTHIGGDNDANGYYWYSDVSGNLYRQNTVEYPIIFTLAGAGTSTDPYLINSYDDLIQAQLKLGSIFKLNIDIDMLGKPNFMLGSYINPFKGTFDGNNKTINNYTLNLPQIGYIGFFGTNTGTIKNLTLNNVDVNGVSYIGAIGGTNSGTIAGVSINNNDITGYHYTAGITGYNSGTLKGLSLTGVNVSGQDSIGGITGRTDNGTIIDSIVSGNVTGNNDVGLAVGYFYSNGDRKVANIVVDGNVSGNNYVGGIVGHTYTYWDDSKCNIRGVYTNGSVTSIGTSVGRILGGTSTRFGGPAPINAAALLSITLNGGTVTSTSVSSNHGLDISSSDLSVTTTYTDRGFNFTDEALEYIWYLDGGIAKFRQGSL